MMWLAAGAGVFTILAAAGNWDWFFNNYKARWFVDTLGRNGARVFYGALGVFILGTSVAMACVR